jgi:hypothetical protein
VRRHELRAALLVAPIVAVVACGRRTSTLISADPTIVADAAPQRPTVSFTQATIEENDGVDVSLSWPILVLPANRGAAMSSTIENALRADAEDVVDEHRAEMKRAGAGGGEWLDGWFVHIACAPTLVSPDLVSVACRHAWNRGNVPDDHDWVTTYAWSTATGTDPIAIDDVVSTGGRTALATLALTAMKDVAGSLLAHTPYTVDDVARNDLEVFFFDRDGMNLVFQDELDPPEREVSIHLAWTQVRSATRDTSIVDRMERAAHAPDAITQPLVASAMETKP